MLNEKAVTSEVGICHCRFPTTRSEPRYLPFSMTKDKATLFPLRCGSAMHHHKACYKAVVLIVKHWKMLVYCQPARTASL